MTFSWSEVFSLVLLQTSTTTSWSEPSVVWIKQLLKLTNSAHVKQPLDFLTGQLAYKVFFFWHITYSLMHHLMIYWYYSAHALSVSDCNCHSACPTTSCVKYLTRSSPLNKDRQVHVATHMHGCWVCQTVWPDLHQQLNVPGNALVLRAFMRLLGTCRFPIQAIF